VSQAVSMHWRHAVPAARQAAQAESLRAAAVVAAQVSRARPQPAAVLHGAQALAVQA
jgi:beta-phosphoglucomutase-like phosphatase (HAD superfamily)